MFYAKDDIISQPERKVAGPYSSFDPRAYISEYYSSIGTENQFLLDFYHQVYSRLESGLTILEFGGGPTIYQILSASRCASEIVFCDFLERNLSEILNWKRSRAEAFSWDQFAAIVADLEGADIDVEERARMAVTRIVKCDALSDPIIPPIGRRTFDVVSSGFCLECISPDKAVFTYALMNVAGWVAPAGVLILTMLKNSESYSVGNNMFPAYPVSTAGITALLNSIGFVVEELDETEAEYQQGYDGIIAVQARRR